MQGGCSADEPVERAPECWPYTTHKLTAVPSSRCADDYLGVMAPLLWLLHASGALVTPPLTAASLWSRSSALTLLNHPLLTQIGTGALPMGSFHRLLVDRRLLVEAVRDGAAPACASLSDALALPAAELLRLCDEELASSEAETAEWVAAAAAAGRTIEVADDKARCPACTCLVHLHSTPADTDGTATHRPATRISTASEHSAHHIRTAHLT